MCGNIFIDKFEEIKKSAMLEYNLNFEEMEADHDPNQYYWEEFEAMDFSFLTELYTVMGYSEQYALDLLTEAIQHRNLEQLENILYEAQDLAREYEEMRQVMEIIAEVGEEQTEDEESEFISTKVQQEEEDLLDCSGYEADDEMDPEIIYLPNNNNPEHKKLVLSLEISKAPETNLRLRLPEPAGEPRARWMFYPDPDVPGDQTPDKHPQIMIYCRPIFHEGEYVYTPIFRVAHKRFLIEY